jgi:hypothetical protein
MTAKTITTTDDRLAEALELAERRRVQANEANAFANERGLALERATAAQADADRRAEEAERTAADLRGRWEARDAEFEAAVTARNEATAVATGAQAAREAAEDELERLGPLFEEAKAQLSRLEPESRQLRERVEAFDSRIAATERRLVAAAGAAAETLEWAASTAIDNPLVDAVPDFESLRVQLLSLADKISLPSPNSEHEQRAKADREAAIRRRTTDATEKLGQAVAAAVADLRA